MFDLFYRNRRLLVLTIALIGVAGVSAYQTLPRMEDPELISRNAIVKTRFPGADAERVEALVTEKIEEELFDIEEIKTIESTSRAGISIITVELKDEVVDVDNVWSRVRDKLGDVRPELPKGAAEPELDELEVRGYALIAALTWDQEDEPSYAVLRRRAEDLEDRLRAISGTEKAELFGEPDEEIIVEIQPARLAAMGLTVSDVSRQIGQSDSKVSAGLMRNSTAGDVLIEVTGELDSLQRIRQTPIRFGRDGQSVLLGDVATIKKGIKEPASDLAFVRGRPAVAVGVFVESDRRVDLWAEAARRELKEFRSQLPDGIGLELVFDQSRYTEQRLADLAKNLLLGALAVTIVVFVMMGWRSAFIVSIALPLASLMVLAGMKLLGIPMHQMSVTGLIVALGLLIDNAIVIVDEVQEHLRDGMPPQTAIRKTTRHLAIPLLGSTLTTALAFAPIALMPGSVGEFVGTIAVSVILALFSSLFLALTVIPALSGLLHRWGRSAKRDSWWQAGVSPRSLTTAYRWLLDRLFARPLLGIALAVALPVIGFVQSSQLIEQFFPPTERDMVQIELELPAGASLEQTQSAVLRARQKLLAHPEVADVHWFIGKSAPSFFYNLISDQENAAYYAQGVLQLKSSQATVPLIRTLQDELDASFPEGRVLVRQLEQGPPFDAPIELRLYGPDLDRLAELGDRARGILAGTPDVTHTHAGLSESLPKLSLQVDEEKSRLAGLDHSTIAAQLDRALEGAVGGSLLEATEELPVRVRLADSGRGDLSRIASLDLLPATGTQNGSRKYLPVSALGRMQLVPERATITRRNGRRVNTVQGYVTAGVLPGKVLADYRAKLEAGGFELPPGYSMDFGGETEERNEAVGKLAASVGVLLVLMVATLVLSFGSFRMAGIIGAVAALSLGLGLGSLWLFGYPFGFMAIIGTMGLIGVAMNDAIVVLAALREDPDAENGDHAAVSAVVFRSTRHVLATTVTTVAGFLPLIVAGGGFWPPLAITIAGGVFGATLLALVLVPSAFLLVSRPAVEAAIEPVAFDERSRVLVTA